MRGYRGRVTAWAFSLILGCGFLTFGCTSEPPPLYGATALIPAVQVNTDSSWPTLDERMARYGVTAISLARIEAFEVVEVSAYGQISRDDPSTVTSQSTFQAASLSKPVTALALMSLVDEGRVALQHPANSYLRAWRIPQDEADDGPVTIGQLLSHTSGLGPQSYPGLDRGTSPPTLGQILDGAPEAYCDPVAPISESGSYGYSGGGYMVLQALIEDVSGSAFEAFMQTQVFDRAGMEHSTFQIRDGADGAAIGHDWQGSPIVNGWADYPQAAAAGLWSTPTDLARLMTAYGRSYHDAHDQFLRAESARMMAREVVSGMGLGFGVEGANGTLRLSHAGWTLGYRSFLLFYPETGNGVVIMTNGQAGHHLIDDVLRTYGRIHDWAGFGDSMLLDPVDWSPERRGSLEGRYEVAPARFVIEIASVHDGYEILTPRGSRYRAIPAGPGHLLLTETGERITVNWTTGRLGLWGMSAQPVD